MDSHEIREVFLAKIYELSNPRFSLGGMEDDFRCMSNSLILHNNFTWQCNEEDKINVLNFMYMCRVCMIDHFYTICSGSG